MPSWLRRSSPQPSHPTQGGSRKRRGRGLGSRWCHRRSLQQREVTWFGVSFCVWAFGAHTQVCARVCAVQCVERIVRAARRPRSVWRGADLLNMNKLGVRVRSHTTSYIGEQPSARTTAICISLGQLVFGAVRNFGAGAPKIRSPGSGVVRSAPGELGVLPSLAPGDLGAGLPGSRDLGSGSAPGDQFTRVAVRRQPHLSPTLAPSP